MHFSFNGVIAPYTYACPYAHKLRNILKIYPPKKEEDVGNVVPSAREEGIRQHEQVKAYLAGEQKDYEHKTLLIEWVKKQPIVQLETQEFYSLDFKKIESKPEKEHYISTRKDVVVRSPSMHTVIDWKFGNPEYGTARHYDEVIFFSAMEAVSNPDVGEWQIIIHFPKADYTAPIKKYSAGQMSRHIERYRDRIDVILNDKFMKPKPEFLRCRLCNYRSEESGGCGECEYTVV